MIRKAALNEQELKWPSVSENERNRRWGRVKDLMRAEQIDCLVVFGLKSRERFDCYLTNDRAGGVVIFPLEGELVHLSWGWPDVASHLESSLRNEALWVRDVRIGATGHGVVEVLLEKGYERANIGIVGLDTRGPGEREGYVPYRTWAYILENLPNANFQEVSSAYRQMVFLKSDEELKLVRRAAEIGEVAAEAMMKVTRPGTSESEIYAATMNQIYLNGARGGVSPAGHTMIIHSGPDNMSWAAPAWVLRGQPPRVLQKGDVLQTEIFPHYGGMEAQLQMCIAIEPVDPVNKECAKIARQSYEAGLKALRPGVTFGDVVEIMEKPLNQAKAWYLTPLIHSLNPLHWISGTGVGIENLPGIERYKGAGRTPVIGADLVIQAGTVWELEPNACIRKHKVNIGGTVIVTKEGAVALNEISTKMRVIV
jgi:Xaa-Pro aminopeptidase